MENKVDVRTVIHGDGVQVIKPKMSRDTLQPLQDMISVGDYVVGPAPSGTSFFNRFVGRVESKSEFVFTVRGLIRDGSAGEGNLTSFQYKELMLEEGCIHIISEMDAFILRDKFIREKFR